MKDQNSTKYKVHDRTIYRKYSQRGWSIVIMPDGIRLDNFHGYPHIHWNKDHVEEIIYDDYETVLNIIRGHFTRGKDINLSNLRKELVK
jgi:hypothetical protein